MKPKSLWYLNDFRDFISIRIHINVDDATTILCSFTIPNGIAFLDAQMVKQNVRRCNIAYEDIRTQNVQLTLHRFSLQRGSTGVI